MEYKYCRLAARGLLQQREQVSATWSSALRFSKSITLQPPRISKDVRQQEEAHLELMVVKNACLFTVKKIKCLANLLLLVLR